MPIPTLGPGEVLIKVLASRSVTPISTRPTAIGGRTFTNHLFPAMTVRESPQLGGAALLV